jgi:5'-methylthioinosine phosphorylase
LQQQGVKKIIAVNAVGGISDNMPPLTLALPNQIIDYTSGREHSFFDGENGGVTHIDFSWPYSAGLRALLMEAALQQGQALVASGTYACTNGPRLETSAEISRLKNDGCHMVGMTGMPEAALARELEMEYAALALVVNWAAGINDKSISMAEIMACVEQGIVSVKSLLGSAARLIEK